MRNWQPRIGLLPKLMAALIGVMILVVALMTWLASARLSKTMHGAYASKGEALALAVASAAEETAGMDVTTIQSAVDANKTVEGVVYIYIEDEHGRVIVHTFSPSFPRDLRASLEQRSLLASSLSKTRVVPNVRFVTSRGPRDAMDVSAPIGGGELGVVHVGMDENLIHGQVDELRRAMLGYGALAVVLGGLLSALVALGAVILPLRKLERVTTEISSSGELGVTIPVGPRDELGDLARSFARMVERLRAIGEERAGLLKNEREARAEAVQANRAKDLFLATLSHELRTPLTTILGQSHLLQRMVDDETARRSAASIERSAKTQARLISDLLDISRIIAGKLRLSYEPTDLVAVLNAAVETVRGAAESKLIDLQVHAERGLVVHADPTRLQQVVWNLLSNAIKFTPDGGRVVLRLERAANHARITVRDTGRGIPAAFLPHVFDRFAQADGADQPGMGGLGLGLAIVRQLVELHCGAVRAESEGEGRGATFTVLLPLSPEGTVARTPPQPEPEEQDDESDAQLSAPAEVPQAEPRSGPLSGIRVLLVDDDQEALAMVTNVLASAGAVVRTAQSAQEASATLDAFAPQVLLCDLAMPGTDGYQFIRALRRERGPFVQLPAAALTAHAGEEDRRRALAEGFQLHLAKPVDAPELIHAVEQLAGARPPPRGLRS